MARIDPTARVADGARLGADTEIGPYCTVGPEVTLGDGCRLASHVVLTGWTEIGPRTAISPFVTLGSPPQSVHYKGERTQLVVGADCVIRENVTMNTGTTAGGGVTRVGDRCMFMVGTHVAHDCIVGNNVTFTNLSGLAGHCVVGDHVFIGGLSAIHQFVRIGDHAIVGGMTGIEFDVIPFGAALGGRAELGGLNLVGLKRRGFSREAIHALRRAYRMLFFGPNTLADRIERVAQEFAGDPNVQRIVEFIRAGKKRRLTLPREDLRDEET